MKCSEILNNYNTWIALISAASAFVAALMAFLSNKHANKSQSIAYASLLAPHFYNVRDILNYVHNWGGLSQNILNEKKQSVPILKSMLPFDTELQEILSQIDLWLSRQTQIQEVVIQYDNIIKRHLNLNKH